jgi:hypothetical protein
LITEAGLTCPEVVVDDYWKDAAELTEGTDEFENGACGP